MDTIISMQSDLLKFRELTSGISPGETVCEQSQEISSKVLQLIRKYSASESLAAMVELLICHAERLFPFLILNTKDELLLILSESRGGHLLKEEGLKGFLKRKFEYLNSVETAYILYLELFCKYCVSQSHVYRKTEKQDAESIIAQAAQIGELITGLRLVFDNVANSELTIDKVVRMVQSLCGGVTLTKKEIDDILSGKGRLTLCTTPDSMEARESAKMENIEYVLKDGQITFSMRIGIDVNMEVEATPRMASLLRSYNIQFVEKTETCKYVIDYQQYKIPADFTFGQMLKLLPKRNYFAKAIKYREGDHIDDNTFAKIKAYDSSGKINTYRFPPPVRWEF